MTDVDHTIVGLSVEESVLQTTQSPTRSDGSGSHDSGLGGSLPDCRDLAADVKHPGFDHCSDRRERVMEQLDSLLDDLIITAEKSGVDMIPVLLLLEAERKASATVLNDVVCAVAELDTKFGLTAEDLRVMSSEYHQEIGGLNVCCMLEFIERRIFGALDGFHSLVRPDTTIDQKWKLGLGMSAGKPFGRFLFDFAPDYDAIPRMVGEIYKKLDWGKRSSFAVMSDKVSLFIDCGILDAAECKFVYACCQYPTVFVNCVVGTLDEDGNLRVNFEAQRDLESAAWLGSSYGWDYPETVDHVTLVDGAATEKVLVEICEMCYSVSADTRERDVCNLTREELELINRELSILQPHQARREFQLLQLGWMQARIGALSMHANGELSVHGVLDKAYYQFALRGDWGKEPSVDYAAKWERLLRQRPDLLIRWAGWRRNAKDVSNRLQKMYEMSKAFELPKGDGYDGLVLMPEKMQMDYYSLSILSYICAEVKVMYYIDENQ